MDTKTIDEYIELNDAFIKKAVRLKNLTIYIEKAIHRLSEAEYWYFRKSDLYFRRILDIRRMSLERWILRYKKELNK